jgi:glycosyltransferase involved in cell wall biosynthesis
MARVVLVESYYGGSHRSWADAWIRHSRHDISLVTHPDEFWRWRLRGGAVTLAADFNAAVEADGGPDAVVVSGLVDVAAFAGHTRRSLGNTPLAVYVHESQLLYPPAPNQRADTSAALVNWQSLVASDAVWFNSSFHREALQNALPGLLGSQPAPTHRHLIDPVFARASVLWPGVEAAALISGGRTERPVPRVLWNQRWDHDKNPHAVFSALAQLAEEGVAFTVALAGQNQRPNNPDFAWVYEQLGDRIDHHGYLPDDAYQQLLLSCDVVVSAADHEFFGIAIVEALAAGAVPVLPTRLSFPELVEPQWHEAALYPDGALRARLRSVLHDIDAARDRVKGLRLSMGRFDAAASAHAHDEALDRLIGTTER